MGMKEFEHNASNLNYIRKTEKTAKNGAKKKNFLSKEGAAWVMLLYTSMPNFSFPA